MVGVTTMYMVSTASAILELKLTQAFEGAIPIEIQTIPRERNLNHHCFAVIAHDLSYSGYFNVKPFEVQKSLPNQNLDQKAALRQKGTRAPFVGIGKVTHSFLRGQQLVFRLINMKDQHLVFEKHFYFKRGYERQLAHHIADNIYEALLGHKGIFSTKLAYVLREIDENKAVRYHLQVSDSDGNHPVTVLNSSQPLMSPTWSPDAKQLAFVSFENRRAAIYTLEVKTGQRTLLSAFPGINGAPAWSPDAKRLALVLSRSGAPKLYTLDLQTKALTQVTYGTSIDTEPEWAPDSRSLIFTSDRGGSPQIYRYFFQDRRTIRLSFVGTYNARGRFSPDAKTFVMLHKREGLFNIALQDLDSGDVVLLSHTGRSESPSFSPNGKFIVYASRIGQRGILNLVSTDAKVRLRLPSKQGDVQEPAWSPYLS